MSFCPLSFATDGSAESPSPPGLSAASPSSTDVLAFAITEGAIENHFYRRGPVAAHLLTTSGREQRLIVAFPAGNTGVGLWFESTREEAHFGLAPGTRLDGVEEPGGMRGVTAHLRSSARTLTIRSALLANLRVIRDYIAGGTRVIPSEYVSRFEQGRPVVFSRTTLDGQHHVALRLMPEGGTTVSVGTEGVRFEAGGADGIAFTATALADDPPLTPFPPGGLFNTNAADLPRDREVFAFLASEEKFTAGSWRFLTYFGRDTLISLQLLMPVLKPPVIEGALGSVLERLGPNGEVAHEEAVGEFAVAENQKRHPPPADLLTPVLDYKMIDGEFLLPPAAAAYLLDRPEGRARAMDFLNRKTSGGVLYRDRLLKNLALVLARTAAFVERPGTDTLVSLKPGIPVGNWRDSTNGLGGGRCPFDVNAALVPAALNAAARLFRSPLLGANPALAAQAERAAASWKMAEALFRITVPADEARQQVAAYARSLRLDAGQALAAIDGPVSFHALSIDQAGGRVPVMHSDSSFALFFTSPSPEYLDSAALEIIRPFPAGLRADVGLVVANPVFGGQREWDGFTRADYHGTVVWSWQQALMAAGLARQLARDDLPTPTREKLKSAQRLLWDVIERHRAQSSGELWSWEPKAGHAVLVPFGQASGHTDESNAAQLWSTVYLAVQPPASR